MRDEFREKHLPWGRSKNRFVFFLVFWVTVARCSDGQGSLLFSAIMHTFSRLGFCTQFAAWQRSSHWEKYISCCSSKLSSVQGSSQRALERHNSDYCCTLLVYSGSSLELQATLHAFHVHDVSSAREQRSVGGASGTRTRTGERNISFCWDYTRPFTCFLHIFWGWILKTLVLQLWCFKFKDLTWKSCSCLWSLLFMVSNCAASSLSTLVGNSGK